MFQQFGQQEAGSGPMMLFGAGLGMVGAGLQMQATDQQFNLTQQELDTQSNQIEAAETARSFNRVNNLKDILNSNLAVAAARGISPGAGSFKAIQQKSAAKFDEDERMDELNTEFKENRIEQERKKADIESEAKDVGLFTKVVTSLI